jgi:serine/threonine protein kinase
MVAMSDNDPSVADPLGQIADEFVEAFRRGQRPTVEEFARRYPEHADAIREFLPALVLMEKAKAVDGAPDQQRPAQASVAAPLRQLGDYEILREVGRGGMGVVYEAQQLSLGRHVAIKVPPPHALLDPRQLGRFQREARSAARLHHTNIVPVFGVGEQDGTHYYVMQFIAGLGLDVVLDELRHLRQPRGKPTLAGGDAPGRTAAHVARGMLTGEFRQPEEKDEGGRMQAEGRSQDASDSSVIGHPSSFSSATIHLPGPSGASTLSESGGQYWQSVARIGMQVADALAHAASQGVLHRDIKPSNLLLDDTGNVWVTDFGLAKAQSDSDNLTHTGDIVGTLRYMAPERFNGQGDVRSDVYSLGLTLYEMLALRPAFDETDRNRLVKQVMHDEPLRPRKVTPGVPRDLETVVLKAITRDPAHRYQTPAELADDLKRYVEDRPVRARRVGNAERLRRWCRRNPLPASLLAGIMLVTLAGFAGVFWQWREAEAARKDETHQRGLADTLRQGAEAARDEARQNAARAEQSQKETEKALAEVESKKAEVERSLSKAEAAEEEGRRLLYTTDMRLAPFVWNDDRSTAQQLRALLAKHIPENKAAAAPRPDLRGFEWHYYQHLLESGAAVFSGHGVAVVDGAFAANGQVVTLDQNGQVRRWDLGSQGEEETSRRDLPGGPGARVRVLSPNGRLAAFARDNKVHLLDTSTGRERFVLDTPDDRYCWLIFSPDSDRFVIVDKTIRWINAENGAVIASVDQPFERGSSLALSADGLTLAVAGHGPLGKQLSIFRLDATRKTVTPLARDIAFGGTQRAVAMSPDGQRVAVGAKLSGAVYVHDTTTGRLIAKHESAHASPVSAIAFAADGARLATADAEGTIKVWADAQKLGTKGVALRTLKGHEVAINTVRFSAEG